jgi:F0F1-type ATP synthase membrane subunit c/vacuolar-type H+-ATPase subunit K
MQRRNLSPVTSQEEPGGSVGPDRALLAAAVAFAAAAGLGSVVAIRDELPGEPLGITVPLSVPAGLAVGWGAAVAAPWPMPAAALIAAVRAQRAGAGVATGLLCAGIGLGCVAGTLVEPVSRRPGTWSPGTRLAITANLASSAALVVAGWRHYTAARR